MKYNDNGTPADIYVKTFDTLPVGTEVDYDGETVPDGWSEIQDPNTYSANEVKIGTWFDKPLYRKILTLDALKNNGSTGVNYNSTYIIKSFDVYVSNPTAGFKFKLPISGTNYISVYNDTNNYNIVVQTVSDRTGFTDNYVIIEYTKTTD